MDVPKSLHGRPLQPLFPKLRRNGGKRFFINTLTEETSKNRAPTTCPGTKALKPQVQADFIHEYDTWEFYDLRNDPNELKNLIDDSSVKATIEEMKKRLVVLKEFLS